MRTYAIGLVLALSAWSPCVAGESKGPASCETRYKRGWDLANKGSEQGIRMLYDLIRESSEEDAESLVGVLYALLHRFPEQWVRALVTADRIELFLENAGLGYEVPSSCASPEACSNEIIARLEKLRGTAEEKRIARLVIATLKRTMKG